MKPNEKVFYKIITNLGSIKDLSDEVVYTKFDILAKVAEREHTFRNSGINVHSRCIIRHGNSVDFFVDLFTIWKLGAIAILLPPDFQEEEVSSFSEVLGGAYLICKNSVPLYKSGLEKSWWHNVKSFSSADNPALILMTSGTSSLPKGVVFSLEGLLKKWCDLSKIININDFSVSLCLLPTSFSHGLLTNSLFPLVNGGKIVIGEPFSLPVIKSLEKTFHVENISFFSSIPTIWRIFFEFKHINLPNNLRRIHCGSEPIDLNLINRIKSFAPYASIFNTYGLTETASWISGSDLTAYYDSNNPQLKEASGAPIGLGWGKRIELHYDEDDKNNRGEIVIVGKPYCLGYFSLNGICKSKFDGNSFKTGDLGKRLENGEISIIGRKKNIIISGGQNIYAEELESALSVISGIKEVCVFPVPHDLLGSSVAVAIVAKENFKKEDVLIQAKKWARNNLRTSIIPTKWQMRDNLPLNKNGKKDRAALCRDAFI